MITKNEMYINFLKIKNGNIKSFNTGRINGYTFQQKKISLFQYNKVKELLKNNKKIFIIEHETKLSSYIIKKIKIGKYDFMINQGDNNE